jgi:hypothetical protein
MQTRADTLRRKNQKINQRNNEEKDEEEITNVESWEGW